MFILSIINIYMSDKKIAKEMKGVHINWEHGKIFPKYKYNSGPHVSIK